MPEAALNAVNGHGQVPDDSLRDPDELMEAAGIAAAAGELVKD